MVIYKKNKLACIFLFLMLLFAFLELDGVKSSDETVVLDIGIENLTGAGIDKINFSIANERCEVFLSNSGSIKIQPHTKINLTAHVKISASDLPCRTVLTLNCLLTHSGKTFSLSKEKTIELKKNKTPIHVDFSIYEMDYIDPLTWCSPYGEEPDKYHEISRASSVSNIKEIPRTLSQNPSSSPNSKKLLVLIEESIYSGIENKLSEYVSDASARGYAVQVAIYVSGNPTSVRDYIKGVFSQGDTGGCLLIGNIPAAWFEMECWVPSTHEEFPCDLYYMDLDGTWGDQDSDGIFDIHEGDTTPEIWTGRLKADNIDGDEVDLLNDYFTKSHNYKTGNHAVYDRALIYIDDDWDYMASGVNEYLSRTYGKTEVVSDKNTTNADDYKSRLSRPKGYEWIHLQCHGWGGGHVFHTNGLPAGTVYSSDYLSIEPKTLFYNLFVCSGARFTYGNYLAGSCISNSNGLLAVGSTKVGGMFHFEDFYDPISQERCIGEAFKEWFVKWGETSRCWFYGMVIIGDPTLKVYTKPITLNVQETPDPTTGAPEVTLRAMVDDSTTGNSNIKTAEYFIDIVGADGTGTVMNAEDGLFDSPTEKVVATVDVRELSIGAHTLYVHGQDTLENWGACKSIAFNVTYLVNPVAAFWPVAHYHLAQVNDLLSDIQDKLPEDVPGDIQALLDEMQEHINNANTTGNSIYANNEFLKALKCCEDIQEKLDITYPL